jgi:hypothetical protein
MEHHTGRIRSSRSGAESVKQHPPRRLNHQLAVDLVETQGGSRLGGGSRNQKRRRRGLWLIRLGWLRGCGEGNRPHQNEWQPKTKGCRCNQANFFFSSIMRWMIGVRINSMAKPILPPFTTIEVGVDMKEPLIMLSR